MNTQIKNFSLSVVGLTINNLSFCPRATCELLKEAGFIEDWTTDNNGEPVILYADHHEPNGFGFEKWYRFQQRFFINERVAQMLLEHIGYTQTANRIDSLLNVAA